MRIYLYLYLYLYSVYLYSYKSDQPALTPASGGLEGGDFPDERDTSSHRLIYLPALPLPPYLPPPPPPPAPPPTTTNTTTTTVVQRNVVTLVHTRVARGLFCDDRKRRAKRETQTLAQDAGTSKAKGEKNTKQNVFRRFGLKKNKRVCFSDKKKKQTMFSVVDRWAVTGRGNLFFFG